MGKCWEFYNNSEKYPRVMCHREPFGDKMPEHPGCYHFITEAENTAALAMIHLCFSKVTYRKLSRYQRDRLTSAIIKRRYGSFIL